jgi:hypothetical protein
LTRLKLQVQEHEDRITLLGGKFTRFGQWSGIPVFMCFLESTYQKLTGKSTSAKGLKKALMESDEAYLIQSTGLTKSQCLAFYRFLAERIPWRNDIIHNIIPEKELLMDIYSALLKDLPFDQDRKFIARKNEDISRSFRGRIKTSIL